MGTWRPMSTAQNHHGTDVFYWCRGQDDNIGDALLRRRLVTDLRATNNLHVYVGSASDSFLTGLRLDDSSRQYTSPLRWLTNLTKASLSGRAVLVLNPGEVAASQRSAVSNAALLPFQFLVQLRGGRAIRLGAAFMGNGLTSLPLRLSKALSSEFTWRDTGSQSEFGQADVFPDWAFGEALPSGSTDSRRYLAIVARGDRSGWDADTCTALRRVAAELQLTPIVIVQVRRDTDRAETLAEQLGAETLRWPAERNHLDQERQVRDVLAASKVIVGDRLHGLVIGVTEGAVPVGLMTNSYKKIDIHMQAAGIECPTFVTAEMDTAQLHEAIVEHVQRVSPDISTQAADAYSQVQKMADLALAATRPTELPFPRRLNRFGSAAATAGKR